MAFHLTLFFFHTRMCAQQKSRSVFRANIQMRDFPTRARAGWRQETLLSVDYFSLGRYARERFVGFIICSTFPRVYIVAETT